ncbi:MAG: IS5 family transposase, partial [Luteimonas sp.]
MKRHSLSDSQWKRIAPLVSGKPGDPGRTGDNNRRFVDAVLWIAHTGAPWRDLPPHFGDWNTIYQRFARWEKRGVWRTIFTTLAADADFEEAFIDSTSIRAHQHATGAPKKTAIRAFGRSRGGLTSKIHAVVEGLGQLATFTLSPGQASDIGQAQPLLEAIPAPNRVAADKADDADAFVAAIQAKGAEVVIPPKANRLVQRAYDRHHSKSRNLVERFFCRIKQFRRIATRYEKLAARFTAFIQLAA